MTSPQDFDAIILGCGISGLVAGSILTASGCSRVALVDEFPHIGGNHIDYHKDGYTFDVGSLIFQDDSPLLDHFPTMLAAYQEVQPSWGKLNPQGKIVNYPISISEELIKSGVMEWCRIIGSILYARTFQWRITNAHEFARYWIGSRLLHISGLGYYLRRFFGVASEEIDVSFATKRMLWIRDHATLRFWSRKLFGSARATGPSNRQLVRPRSGFFDLYSRARNQLEEGGAIFHLGEPIEKGYKLGDEFHVKVGGRVLRAPRLISTIPVNCACDVFGIEPVSELPTVSLISLFYSFEGHRGFDQSILYNFSFEGAWKRLTMYSDFYDKNKGREFFTVEVISDLVDGCAEKAANDFRRHTQNNGLFLGSLQVEGNHLLHSAYPIHTKRAEQDASLAIGKLKALGIQSFGRQGGFDYQPTARVSTMVARDMLPV